MHQLSEVIRVCKLSSSENDRSYSVHQLYILLEKEGGIIQTEYTKQVECHLMCLLEHRLLAKSSAEQLKLKSLQ